MRTAFTRLFAYAVITLGVIFILLGVVLAVVAWQVPAHPLLRSVPTGQDRLDRLAACVLLVVTGFAFGAPQIVFGQLVLVFLDVRRRLVRIDRRLRRWERSNEREPPQVERLRYPPLDR